MCASQLTAAGLRGRRGRRAAQTVDIIDVELVTTQHHNITVDTVKELTSILATVPADFAQVPRALSTVFFSTKLTPFRILSFDLSSPIPSKIVFLLSLYESSFIKTVGWCYA